jgi:tetratricopeptide (TPR) repeat protein
MRIKGILYGILLLLMSLLFYSLLNSGIELSYPIFLTLAGGGLCFIITGLFENKKNYNENLYLTITVAIILVVLILIYNHASSLTTTGMIYSNIIGGIFTLITLLRFNSFNKWKKSQEFVNSYDKILELDSEDTTSLNNKGVRLFEIGQYKEAVVCFEKILEIDSKDAAACIIKGLFLKNLENIKKH